jgi:hypothetical protein
METFIITSTSQINYVLHHLLIIKQVGETSYKTHGKFLILSFHISFHLTSHSHFYRWPFDRYTVCLLIWCHLPICSWLAACLRWIISYQLLSVPGDEVIANKAIIMTLVAWLTLLSSMKSVTCYLGSILFL